MKRLQSIAWSPEEAQFPAPFAGLPGVDFIGKISFGVFITG
jgi:hypothetical protein